MYVGTVLTRHYVPPLLLLIKFSYKGGLIIEYVVYTPRLLAVERARETAKVELSVTVSCDEARNASVLQGKGS